MGSVCMRAFLWRRINRRQFFDNWFKRVNNMEFRRLASADGFVRRRWSKPARKKLHCTAGAILFSWRGWKNQQ
jgi:hypothetical protein